MGGDLRPSASSITLCPRLEIVFQNYKVLITFICVRAVMTLWGMLLELFWSAICCLQQSSLGRSHSQAYVRSAAVAFVTTGDALTAVLSATHVPDKSVTGWQN